MEFDVVDGSSFDLHAFFLFRGGFDVRLPLSGGVGLGGRLGGHAVSTDLLDHIVVFIGIECVAVFALSEGEFLRCR